MHVELRYVNVGDGDQQITSIGVTAGGHDHVRVFSRGMAGQLVLDVGGGARLASALGLVFTTDEA